MASPEARIAALADSDALPAGIGRRAFLALAAAAGIAVGMGACARGSSVSTAGGSQHPAISGHVTTMASDFFVEYSAGADQASRAIGFPLTMHEEQGNVNTALGQLGTVRATGGKAMFGHNASEAECVAMVRAAAAANMLYACTFTAPANFTPADSDTWVRFITPSTPEISYRTAKAMFKKVGGRGTVIHIPGQKGSTPDQQRTAGLRRAAKEFPGITIVTTPDGNWVAQDARKVFENTLPSVGDFVGVFAQNDNEAEGVIAALDARGITDKVITGFDGNKKAIEYIAEGKQFMTSATVPGLSSGLTAVSLFDAINGVELTLPEQLLFQGAILVDADNAADLYKKLHSGDLPFDWAKMSRTLHPEDWDPQTLLTPINPHQFYADAPNKRYTLNAAWDNQETAIAAVKTQYANRFQGGPLIDYKATMV
jgi:ribose transport system substrate-binding protein